MKNEHIEHSKGTFILGSYYSPEEVTEIETNPIFKDTWAKKVLDLRRVNEDFRQNLLETKFCKLLIKVLDKIAK